MERQNPSSTPFQHRGYAGPTEIDSQEDETDEADDTDDEHNDALRPHFLRRLTEGELVGGGGSGQMTHFRLSSSRPLLLNVTLK